MKKFIALFVLATVFGSASALAEGGTGQGSLSDAGCDKSSSRLDAAHPAAPAQSLPPKPEQGKPATPGT